MKKSVSEDSIVGAAPEQVSCDLGGEAAILDLQSGVYYGLDPVGARVWELIKEPKRVSAVRDVLLEEYEVEAAVCTADLLELLQDLANRSLISVAA